jgi:hypothetical protein
VSVRSLLTAAAIPVALLLAAFFAFVGYHKAFAPLAELAQHRVWTLALPEWLGRTIGWSELLLAAILLSIAVPRLRAWAGTAALLLVINQLAAAAVHWSRAETDALPQNAVLVALLVLVGLAARHRQKSVGETS